MNDAIGQAGLAPALAPPRPSRLWRIAAAAVCYTLAALAGALVGALSPGLPPVWPAAGMALALLLLWGLHCWPGIFLGALLAYLSLWPEYSLDAALSSGVLATAATVQAVLGALLTRRFLAGAVPLVRDGDTVRFLLYGGPAACLASGVLVAAIPAARAAPEVFGTLTGGFSWWAGNALGVLLFAPLAMAVWPGRHAFRRLWGLAVALPLLFAAGVIALGNVALERIESNEARMAAERRKAEVDDAAFVRLPQALAALRSVERLFAAADVVTRDEFTVFTRAALDWPGLLAVEWVPRVPAAQRAAFEAAARAAGLAGFAIRERDRRGELVPAPPRAEYFPGYYVEPASAGATNLGFDFGSLPRRRTAMARAAGSARAIAVEPAPLIQSGRLGVAVFVPVYAAGFDAARAAPHERRAALGGFVLGVFDVERMFAPLAAAAAARHMLYRVSDVTPGDAPRTVLASLAPEVRPDWVRELPFAGRVLRLELASGVPYWRSGASLGARAYLGAATVVAFLIGLAALGAAARRAVTAAQVADRTAALRASEQDLEVTLNSIGDGVLATDAQARVTRMNPVAEKLTGWTLAEARGRAIEDVFRIVNEHTGQAAEIPVARVLATGAVQDLANHTVLVARDGTQCAIADSAAPMFGPHGALRGVVLVFRDVSEERAAERALAASERRYREFIEYSPCGVLVQSGGRFAFLNHKAVDLLGAASEQQLLGRPLLDYLHPDSHEAVRARMRDLDAAREVVPAFEERWLRVDGSWFDAEVTAAPYVHAGQPGALVLLQDISERKQAARERDRFFELCVDVLCIVDAEGRFVRTNPAFGAVLHWTEPDCAWLRCQDLVHPLDLAAARAHDAALRAGHGPLTDFECRMRRKDGAYRWLSWSAAHHDGLIYAVASDMTERRKIIAELTAARAEAEHANRAKSAFLAAMSHEIRTPMNGVLGMVDVLTYSGLSEHQTDLVDTIRSSAATLLRIIDDILDFSKIEAGRLEFEHAPVALIDLIEGLCSSLLPVAAQQRVDVALFVSPAIPERILSDEVRLRQIVYNLVGNAIKFSGGASERGGRVRIRLELAGSDPCLVRLSVADNGIGMSSGTLAELFDAFAQAEASTTRRFGGTGLGLAICKRLVGMMDGTIAVESTLGEGSTFTVTIPVVVAPEQPPRTLPDLAGQDCVVVESAAIDARDLQAYLEYAGARVEVVPDVAAAARAAAALDSAVVVTQHVGRTRPTFEALQAQFGAREQVRHLLITRGRRRRGRVVAGNVVMLDGDALRRQAFLRAVAVAAGRASPETFHDPVDELSVSETPQPPTVEAARARGELILVAEDEAINQKVIRQQLALLGYAAEVAENGAEALELWRRGGHGLVLTDLHMPDMDGYMLAASIRREEAGNGRIPVIALTANAMRGEEWRALGAGMDAYLTKPAPLNLLRDTLQHWLAAGARTRPATTAQAAADTRAAHVLDVGVLRDLIGDDVRVIHEFLHDYRASARRLVAELEAATAAGDAQQVGAAAHKLKSASRSVGALQLGEACAALERAGRAGDHRDIRRLLATLGTLAEALEAALEQALEPAS